MYIQEVSKGTFHLTPLGEAALGRQQEVVNLLLANGADFTFKAGVSSQQMMGMQYCRFMLKHVDMDLSKFVYRR